MTFNYNSILPPLYSSRIPLDLIKEEKIKTEDLDKSIYNFDSRILSEVKKTSQQKTGFIANLPYKKEILKLSIITLIIVTVCFIIDKKYKK